MNIYRVIVFVHVISALVFLMAHGVSAMMLFKVSRERKPDNLCNYLEISKMALIPAMHALDLVLLSGITLTIWAKWYNMGWIWTSIALFILVAVVMGKYGSAYMNRVRHAIGIVSPKELKKGIRPVPVSTEQLYEILESGKPRLVATAGMTGLFAIVFLMTVKPF